MKPFALLYVAIVMLMSALFGGKAVAAQQVSLSQKIGEKTCVLTTVVKDDGTYGYVLLPGCGTLVVAMPQQNVQRQDNMSSFALPLPDALAKLFYTEATYIEAAPALQPPGGYVVLTTTNQRYSFRLVGDSPDASLRTLQVMNVSTDSVALRFWPDGKEVVIMLGKPLRLQVAYDTTPDMQLTLLQLNADGSLLLRLQFIDQPHAAGVISQCANELMALSLLGIAGCAGFVLFAEEWLAARKGRVPKRWWVEHVHDPILDSDFMEYQWPDIRREYFAKHKVLT